MFTAYSQNGVREALEAQRKRAIRLVDQAQPTEGLVWTYSRGLGKKRNGISLVALRKPLSQETADVASVRDLPQPFRRWFSLSVNEEWVLEIQCKWMNWSPLCSSRVSTEPGSIRCGGPQSP